MVYGCTAIYIKRHIHTLQSCQIITDAQTCYGFWWQWPGSYCSRWTTRRQHLLKLHSMHHSVTELICNLLLTHHSQLMRVVLKASLMSNSLFTLLTRIRQDCLVLSCPRQRCEHNCRQDKTIQFCLVSTQFQISKFSVVLNIFETEQLQIGNLQDKTVLSCCQLCSHCQHGQDKTRQDSLVLSMSVVSTTYRNSLKWLAICGTLK